jgi:hypothetical protein
VGSSQPSSGEAQVDVAGSSSGDAGSSLAEAGMDGASSGRGGAVPIAAGPSVPSVPVEAPLVPSAAPPSERHELLEDEPATSTWASPLESWEEATAAYPSVREG